MVRFRIWYAALPGVLRQLLVINVAAYAAWVLLFAHVGPAERFVWEHLAFHTSWDRFLLEPWQLVTYSFLHLGERGAAPGLGSLVHVAFNMLWLYWIGRDFEETHGGERILAVYLLASLGGALLSAVAYAIAGSGDVVIHGASASVLGVIAMVAAMYPWRRIGLLFIGPVRLLHLLLIFLALDVVFGLGRGTAVLAHLGGAVTGFAFVQLERRGISLSAWAGWLIRRPPGKKPARGAGGRLARLERWLEVRRPAPGRPEPSVDSILDKISEQGLDSLTDEERDVLERASRD